MIRRSVSAVLLLRDGFTGRPMAPGAVRCALDGRPCRPIWKPGGYMVLTDLEEGARLLTLQSHGYRDERVALPVRPGAALEEAVALKPGPDYPFRGAATRLELTLSMGGRPLAETGVWLALPGRAELKLVREETVAGARELGLFRRGPAALLPLPGPFLLSDGADSELVRLRALEGERGLLAAPLAQSHGRGRALLPAQPYQTGPQGALSAVFPGPGRLEVLAAGAYGSLELAEGENRLVLEL